MKRFVGFLSLMVLILNSVLMPLTYAQEYQDEILGAQVNNTVGDSSNVENANETEGEQNEEAEDASQFPVIEENSQEPEITPVDEPQDEDQEIPSESTLSGGLEGSENTNQEGANGVGSGNDLGETLGSGDDENLNVQTGADQVDDTLSGALISEQLVSSGDVISEDAGSGNIEDLEEDSGILSSVVEAIEGIFNSIRYFFVKDNSKYIGEYKQNGVKVISLKDPVNGETLTIMDRNLGAEDSDITSEDSYGNYYQWGNNNGFEKVDGENVTSNLAVYSLEYEGVGYTRDNKFRVGGNDIWEVDEEGRRNYDELWYLGEDEEIQGPCPEGYHIPSDKEWNKLVRVWTKIHTVDENEGGKIVRSVKGDTLKASLEQAGTGDAEENTIEEENLIEVEELFMKELKLPKAGNYATNGEREDGLGIYWTRTPSDKSYQSEVFSIERYFGEDFNEELLNRANGNSVRCFLDTYEKEVVEYNKEEITGEETFDDVTVSVYAGTGFFPEGTKLLISPIVQKQEISDIKDKISEEDDNIIEDSKLVAFDISFIYRGEEVQPLEGKVVKVTFDYSNNDELSEADKIDEQEVKVFHIDDKDENGEKVEKGEEVVKDVTNIVESEENGIAVADAESFSTYLLTVSAVTTYTVHFDVNGGAGFDNAFQDQEIDEGGYVNRPTKDPYKVGYMFLGWFDDPSKLDDNNATRYKFQGTTITGDLVLYAKWARFYDITYTGIVNGVTYSVTLMDRNMGATETGAMSNATTNSYGFYYQWGNNYGFYYDKGNNPKLNDYISTPKGESSGYGPNNWYYGESFISDDKNWEKIVNKTVNNNLWGGAGDNSSNNYYDNSYKKYTRQGPCPRGYHVPSLGEWHKLIRLFMNNEYPNNDITTILNSTWKNNVGNGAAADYNVGATIRNKIGNTFYLPYAGRLQYNGKTRDRQVQETNNSGPRAPYWASSNVGTDGAFGFELKQKQTYFNLGGWKDEKAQARAVRCFKDNDDYTITWENLEDPSLSESNYIIETDYYVNRDEHPHYDGLTPVRGDTPFIGWYIEGGNKSQVYTQEDLDEFTITEDITFVAKFKTYDIDVEIIPSTGGVVSGVDDYYEGSGISLTAEANEGYQFTGWYDESDNLVSTDNPYEFTADASDGTGLKALFELKQYIVTVVSNDSSKGTINVTQRPYTHGKRIEFSPNYNSGEYKFVKWKLNGEDVKTGGNQYRTGNLVIEYLTSDLTVTGYFSIYDSCNLPWGGSIAHGESTGAYEKATVPYGQSCVQEIRVCNDGNLSGSYEYKNCEIETPTSCDLPWGGILANGESVTGYASASETCPDQCVGQRATCISGEWDIPNFESNYLNSSCTTNGVDPVSDGYTLNSCPEHGYCNYKTGYTVNNYACEAGDVKYKLTSCELGYHTEDWLTCTGNTKFVPCSHNDQIPEHSTEKVVDVPVNWNGVSWDDPVKCSWECDTHYHENGNQCDIDTFDITWKYSTETGEQTVVESYAYGSIPSRLGNNYQTDATGYTFISWTPTVLPVTGDVTYTATYTETPRSYDITWKYQTETGVQSVVESYAYGATPSRVGSDYETAATGYTFLTWTPVPAVVTGNATYTATYNETTKEYSITWVDGDGHELKTEQVAYGLTPSYSGSIPTKSEIDQYTYSFNNTWSPAIAPVTENATYIAQFDSTVRTYRISFVDGDGNIIQSGYVAYDAMPVYEGETPTKTSTPKYSYTFSGSWSPSISKVTGEATYTAQFTETINKYEIIWLDGDGEELKREQVEYDEIPEYSGAVPTKTRTDKFSYTFNDSWSPAISKVTGPATYTAQFDSTINKYRITFVDGDGRIIQSGDVEYDKIPVYTGSTPTKTATAKYTYSFSGSWSPAISKVAGDATYVAEFTGTINKYEITWIDGDGNTLKTEQVAYDEIPEYTGAIPTKARTPQYTYTFNHTWSPAVEAVTGDISYTAQFDEEINKYTITFHSNGGTLVAEQVKDYGTTVDEPADPIRDGYGFSGWYSDSGLTQKYSFESTIGGDLDLYAKWTPIVYSIAYELNGGNLTGGVVNPDTYTIESDTITLYNPERVGYTFLGWTGSNGTTNPETTVSIASGSTGNKTYYANWQANIVDVTIKHYLQDLNPVTNEVLATYSLSGETYSGELADSTITLGNYALNIEGYTYQYGKVNDIETITTTVLPNGSRVIDLYYTRNTYNYVLTTALGSSTTGSSPTGMYYYGAEVLLSGDTGNDCFMWSGWNIEGTILENNMKKTSFIMPANDVTVASSVTEKSYNIVFVGNGSTSGEMTTLTGVMCREEIDLPLNTFKRTGYTFSGWSTTIDGEKKYEDGESVHTLTTGNNVTVDLYALWDINHYQVQWQNYDGYVLDEQTLAYNEMPEYKGGVTPTREADAQFTYSFTGWTPEYTRVEGDQVYTAVYSTTVNKYVVTWNVAGSGTTEEYEYGATPSYKGVPHKDPTKQYTYTFAGWSPTISTVTTGVTYTAIFTPVLRKYTVTWLNSNGDELEVDDEVPYGTTPHYDGATPTKPSDAEHTYIFAGWAPEVGPIEGDTTYHATFSTDTNEYTLTWTNEDGTVLETDENVPYGTTPTYNGATPTKQSDAQYDYTFAGWTPTVHAVTKNQIYQATYTETLRKYTITWKNSNGDTLEVDTNVEYGTTPSYDGSTPTSGGDTQYSYVFDTWSPAVDTVHGDATYTAKYKQNINTYKVTWKNRDGTVLEVVNGVEYGATPTHGDINPIRTGNEQYSYSFAGWTPAISAVHGDVEYTAQFTENLNIYNVNFVNDDLSTLKESLPYAYGTTRLEIVKPDDPTKQDDEQYTYEFSGWTPVITIVTGHVTFMATYKTTLRKYTVIWKNYDGTVLETGVNVPYGTMPSYNGATPTKPSTSQYAYRFVGWSPEVSEVHGDITYTAQFEPDLNKYTVIWKNRDGTVLETDEDLPYGVRPIYDGDEPVKTGDVQYTYVFTGWNPDVDIVTTDITYVAKFDSVVNNYSVTWKNRDNTELEVDDEVPYGTTPHYDGETPVRTGNAQFSYVFKGWSPAVDTVHGDMVYKAQYDEVINKYTVTFENYDGTVLQSDELDYGSTPEYTGETPKKTGDAEFSFIFRGWDSVIMEVHEDATYIAQFDSEINKYTIKFIDGDGNILQSGELAYGTMPVYTGSTPTKTADAQYTYTFNYTWSPAISEVTGEATYEAQFSTTVNEYTITWVDGNGNTLKTEQVAYGETPEYSGETPTKDSTPQYTYTFNNTWSPEIVAVAGDATYTAQFNSSVNEYTITWVDGNGNTLKTEQVAYGETPEYSGETPTKDSTPQYTYTFNNTWSPAVVSVIEDATYIAQFSSTVNKYTITWKDGDGNTLKTDEVAYNGTPIYDGTTPTKTATAEYTYTFNNTWSPVVVSVTEDAIYTAQFNSVKNKYTITWKDGNDVLLYLEQLEYGEIPEYTGLTPTKAATAQYTYTFNNTWSPAIVSVVGDATYTAQFSSTVNKYTITWKDGDNNTIKTEQVAYGTTPVYQGVTPTKTATAQYTYTFNNTWSPAIVSVTEAATYTAQFTENVIKYVIRFTDYDDSLIIEKQVDYGTTSGNYKPADPVREGYTFIGWIPELETVTGSNTYKATYTINQYTVIPEAGNGVERVEGGGTYDYGTEIVLTGYAKEGYHFEGGVTIKEFIVIVGPNSVIARINAIGNSYKVRFQPGGGEGTMDDQEFTYGLTGALKANSFRRNGYTFTGWNDEDGNVYADKGKIYNLATGGILLFTALWKTGEVPPEPPVPSTGETAAGGGRIIPAVDEDEHESADLETGATVQTGDDILGDDTQGETGYTTRTQEEMDAYKYAYKYHITTLAPREAAMPDEYVQRGHMAKMVVNYALNVLHRKLPDKLPKQCKWKDGRNAWESQEIKDYAEKACALGLMGIDMDYFQPYKYVTRAQFGTIFGRLLRGKLPSTPYYAGHLSRLKENGIMTQIDNPEDRIEIRKWAWLMFMRSEKYFKVK